MRTLTYPLTLNSKDAQVTTFLHDDGTWDATLDFPGNKKVVVTGTYTDDGSGTITMTHEVGTAVLLVAKDGTVMFPDLQKTWDCGGRTYAIEVK
jgi:hypothetical protein